MSKKLGHSLRLATYVINWKAIGGKYFPLFLYPKRHEQAQEELKCGSWQSHAHSGDSGSD